MVHCDDERYMRIALQLAKKAEGRTDPNPLVGSLVVKNNRIVGRGYHKMCGLPHAEVNAIRTAGPRAKGATLYVTLEPCGHFGRTPPCTDAIIKSGIKRVVIAMRDPNAINNGRGIAKLKRSGIKITFGVLEDDARSMNPAYIKFITRSMPYVTLKIAESLDGKIATKTGDSKWITSAPSRRYVHDLRSKVGAVMVGVNTLVKDDPLLTSRIRGRKEPVRIVVDSTLKTPLRSRIFSNLDRSPVIIATIKGHPAGRLKKYELAGAEVLQVRSRKGRVDLKDLLKALGRMIVLASCLLSGRLPSVKTRVV